MSITNRDIDTKEVSMGQYFTPIDIARKLVSNIILNDNCLVIEPSFGGGVFLDVLKENNFNNYIGIELDEYWYNKRINFNKEEHLLNKNFYDFNISTNKKIIFVGNPPYSGTANSLHTHKSYINMLCNMFQVSGIREECVFWLLHSMYIIYMNSGYGEIHYILPKSIFTNNSKFFTQFKECIRKHCLISKIDEIDGSRFEGVSQELVAISLLVNPNLIFNRMQSEILLNGQIVSLDNYFCMNTSDTIDFMEIFKKTYLGSVPCESLLVSCPNESLEEFKNRLYRIMNNKNIDIQYLYMNLQYNGKFHLKVFDNPYESNQVQDKLSVILEYVKNIQNKILPEEFLEDKNYHKIQARNDKRYYFRNKEIKKNKNFVYEITPYEGDCNDIFYFTSNPSNSSTDYCGYSDCGDVLRNCSPGCMRFVPCNLTKADFTEYFINWWEENFQKELSCSDVFEYIKNVYKSNWYKERKKKHKRFYFGIPRDFIV